PNLSIPQIRHAIAPSIFWAAVTTITAFLVLNFGGLPGLGQLGTLVGLGVALAATIMIFEFLPPLFPRRANPSNDIVPEAAAEEPVPARASRARVRTVFAVTAAMVALTVATLVVVGRPPVDATANALRPRRSPAYAALEEIQANLNQRREPLWVVVGGKDLTQTAKRLTQVQAVLSQAVTNHLISGFTLPTPLWPRPEFQAENRGTAARLANEGELLRRAAEKNGFAPSSLGLTERILSTWKTASETAGVAWPTNQLSQWILQKAVALTPTNDLALGLVNPEAGGANAERKIAQLERELPGRQVWLSGWELLGHAIFSRVQTNLWKVVAPMIFLVLLSLWLAFRRAPEMLLSLGALLLSGLCLLTVMRLAHWSWNLLSLMAIPLVLGTGVDYSIFMQLALRRYHGDLRMAYHSVGRALLLCGGTAIAAFGTLAWSSNAGMASLGEVCAVGIAFNVLIAIFLAPVWWHAAFPQGGQGRGHR
ncbi:MAG: MMPL family transporter, partial [Limisphaerales bacterium]